MSTAKVIPFAKRRGRHGGARPNSGAKPRNGQRATRCWKVWATEEEYEAAKRVASENGLTVADFIRLATNTAVTDYDEGPTVFRLRRLRKAG